MLPSPRTGRSGQCVQFQLDRAVSKLHKLVMIIAKTPSVKDARVEYRGEPAVADLEDWIGAAIDEGLASRPSKSSVAQIMAAQRKAIG